MNILQPIIQTSRLQLLPLSERFAQDIFKNLGPEITKFVPLIEYQNIEDVELSIQITQIKAKLGKIISFAITDKETGEFLGSATINEIETKTPFIGIWIKKSAQGKKYAKETLSAIIHRAQNHISYKYLLYHVCVDNIPSIRLIESLGGIFETDKNGIIKTFQLSGANNTVLNIAEYRISRN